MTEEEFRQRLEENSMGKYQDAILGLTRNSIFVTSEQVDDENKIPLGYTKMGGNPDLPVNFVWPIFEGLPLTFIAQFRLSDFTAYDTNHELPTTGLLYFFYEAANEPEGKYEQREAHKVIYILDENTPLVRHLHPNQPSNRKYFNIEALPACKVIISNGVTSPIYDHARAELRKVWDTGEEDNCWDKMYQIESSRSHYLLGTPHQIQNDLSIDCVLGSRNLEWKMSYTPEVIEEAKDWTLLFQLSVDSELDIEWGDSGKVYFWIRKQDLQKHNFDQTWALNQSC